MEKEKKPAESKVGKIIKNVIDTNPTLKEQMSNAVVLGWGRMNPITIGHEKLVNKIKSVAVENRATPMVYLSQSQDPAKNPLSYNDKVMLAKHAFGSIIQKSNARTIIEVLKELDSKFQNLILVVGDDRVKEFDTLLNKYNGREFTFDNIRVVSAGARDPDAEGVEGMSASKMRAAAMNGEFAKFKLGLPPGLRTMAQDVYDMVRAGMKLNEQLEISEAVLTLAQRRERALTMRRFKSKIAAARRRMMKRVAPMEKIKARARKKAIRIIRKKVASEKGVNYNELTPAEKMIIDRKVEKRKAAIGKIAMRMIPQVRKADLQRIALAHSGQHNEEVNAMFESFIDQNTVDPEVVAKPAVEKKKRYHMMHTKEGKIKLDRRFRAFRNAPGAMKEDMELLSIIDEIYESVILEEKKVEQALQEKADTFGLPYGYVLETFNEGVAQWNAKSRHTPYQLGFERVNSILAEAAEVVGPQPGKTPKLVKGMKHHLGVGLPFKHMQAHAIANRDLDMDGDVDDLEKMGRDEITGAEKENLTKLQLHKLEHEKMHTRRGDAFESYEMTNEEIDHRKGMIDHALAAMHRRVTSKGDNDTIGNSAFEIAKTYNLGMSSRELERLYRQKHGLAEEKDWKAAITKIVHNKAKMDKKKAANAKHYEKVYNKFDAAEEYGAGDEGTDEVVKRYKKDTPFSESFDINEAFDMIVEENQCALISRSDIRELEKFADELLSKYKIDIEFTKHFGDRMSDERNNPCITVKELKDFFRKVYANQGAKVKGNIGIEAVLKDLQKSLNMPVIIDRASDGDVEVKFKTIMRKKNFTTPNKTIGF